MLFMLKKENLTIYKQFINIMFDASLCVLHNINKYYFKAIHFQN